MSASDTFILETLLTLCLLLIAAKVGGEIAKYFKVAAVVGELMAGILLAPTLFGGFHFLGVQLITVNETVQVFAELGAVLLLFLVGLETRFADFRKSGVTATLVALGGVIVPFVLGYGLVILWGYPHNEALLVGAALTATSIAITVKVLKDIGKFNTRESKVLVGAAVIDDVLGLIVLAIVLGLVKSGSVDLIAIAEVGITSVGFWLALTLFGVFIVAKVIDRLCPRNGCTVYQEIAHTDGTRHRGKHCVIKCHGPQEASIIALCFGFAYVAGMAGLAPILGAFAAGMSVAETKILPTIQEVTEHINFLMAPLFFVVIGTYVNLTGLTVNALTFAAALIFLAMLGKIVGCSVPIYLMHRNFKEAIIVGLGMMSRGEVGLIIAGIGATSGIFSNDVFSAVVLMVVVTTVITPIAMTATYKWFDKKEARPVKPAEKNTGS
ncbi:MAG: glutathione-regulated potassium-efflux system protein KefB [Methanocella sp. PtaU1.Bin125]|nr:MAG: glutathione-regulated potassium-efflux system protein KefB [Methanocella sp. PtaU1.Bin125]